MATTIHILPRRENTQCSLSLSIGRSIGRREYALRVDHALAHDEGRVDDGRADGVARFLVAERIEAVDVQLQQVRRYLVDRRRGRRGGGHARGAAVDVELELGQVVTEQPGVHLDLAAAAVLDHQVGYPAEVALRPDLEAGDLVEGLEEARGGAACCGCGDGLAAGAAGRGGRLRGRVEGIVEEEDVLLGELLAPVPDAAEDQSVVLRMSWKVF